MKKVVRFLVFILVVSFTSNLSVSASSTTRNTTINYQYAGAAFDPNKTYSEFSSTLKVFEKDDYTIIYWVGYNSAGSKSIYMSVTQKNKWLFRGKEVYFVPDNTYDSSLVFANDHLFIKSEKGLSLIIFDLRDGKIKTDTVLQERKSEGYLDLGVLVPITTNGRSGAVYGEKGVFYIFLENEWKKPIKLEDKENTLYNYFVSGYSAVLTSNRDRIIFTASFMGNRVYNIKQKDMIYDEKGQDKVYRFGKSIINAKYLGGKFYALESNDTVINVYDENFKLTQTFNYNVSEKYLDTRIMTLNKGKINIWSFNSFKRSNSIKVVTFNVTK